MRLRGLAALATLAALTAPVLAAAPAYAATQTVTITKAGYVPTNQPIKTGDTVSFANSDTVVHQVLFKQTTGFTCTANPLVIQPTRTESCTWTVPGNYAFSDPNQKGKAFHGTIAVTTAAVPTVSLTAASPVVTYGSTSQTLSGKIDPAATGTTVDILAMKTGEAAFTKLASVSTTAGGAFSMTVTPSIETSYRAEYTSGSSRVVSSVVAVQVRPKVNLVLRSVRKGYANLTTKVISDLTYTGKYVLVQRRNSLGGWTALKRVTIGNFSTARFAVRLPAGTSRLRTILPTAQAGAGYLSSTSRIVLVTR